MQLARQVLFRPLNGLISSTALRSIDLCPQTKKVCVLGKMLFTLIVSQENIKRVRPGGPPAAGERRHEVIAASGVCNLRAPQGSSKSANRG
jgi:hypothetical protein